MTTVYFNNMKPPVDFWLLEDTITFVVLISKLDNLLLHTENKKVGKIEFCAPSIDTEGKMKYNNVKLNTGEDLKVMWIIYHSRPTKEPIKSDTTIYIYVDDIIKMLKCL